MPAEKNKTAECLIAGDYGKVGVNLIKTIGYQDINSNLLLVQVKLTQPNLSHRLRRFRKDGIVRRTRDNKDRRIYYYCLTAKGLDMLAVLKGRQVPEPENKTLNEFITGYDKSGSVEKQLFF